MKPGVSGGSSCCAGTGGGIPAVLRVLREAQHHSCAQSPGLEPAHYKRDDIEFKPLFRVLASKLFGSPSCVNI